MEDIPNPKEMGTGFVNNPAGLLSLAKMDSFNHLLTELNRKTVMEAAAVLAKAGKFKSKKRYQNLSDTAR
ncbi:hypothetical protein [Siphonobacter sp. SORGH_AS_1065]|uniref:hypothetical protein n=1 Tax=Siphonobacter sp. SORGH_AS_1065 TaxID=3041795 RepID=UPI0027847B1F|nr:hypothetical protein [Siphonobacter sp. SORGH_AS_1065]MDQ1090423.1 hypothetical protein [Siphonobacter sp. SORGH_AS_1065]